MRNGPALMLWGDFDEERVDLRRVAAEFGWTVCPFDPIFSSRAVAVVIDAYECVDGWRDRVHASSLLLPGVPVVIAQGFDRERWDCDPVRDGVFDVLLRPLDPGECRQSFGFLQSRMAWQNQRIHAVRAA